ncbi:MAG: Hsp20 family protein, partial [Rhodovibrionaceae bacterium]|nr:Hsp20 family protein [Rhodovibrionaceae bacterium]
PPYNIEKIGDDQYRISMAVAGFGEDELDVQVEDTTLTVRGKAKSEEESEEKDSNFLYRGIARRAFERRFQLAEFIQVTGAKLENGLLHIDLVREVPERMKPRSIAIDSKDQTSKAIEGEKTQKAAEPEGRAIGLPAKLDRKRNEKRPGPIARPFFLGRLL